jgi:nucleoid DNA-binding protein
MATTKNKPAAKKVAAKPAISKPAVKKSAKTATSTGVRPNKDTYNKSSLMQVITEDTGLEQKQVKSVFAALEARILGAVHPKGAGEFTLAGILKIVTVKKPAVKGGKTVKNPFKPGETMVTKSKPASIKVKVRTLSKLKAAASL